MARKRMIDPAIWESEDFSKLSFFARLVWIGLFSNADDEGRGKGNSAYIKSHIFAYDDNLTITEIEEAIHEIEKSMSVRFYEVDGKRYYQLTNWHKFQTINRPSPSQIPAENNTLNDNSVSVQGNINESSNNSQQQDTDISLPKIEKEKEIEREDEMLKENSLTRVKESEETSLSTRTQKHKYGAYKNVLLTEDEYQRLIADPLGQAAIDYFSEYREMKGYKCKNDNLAIRKWAFQAVKEQRLKNEKLEAKTTKEKVSSLEAQAWMN